MLSVRLLAALVPAAAILVVPTAAQAERVATDDAVADAQSIRSDAGEEVFAAAPEQEAADVVRTVVAHGAKRVRVQVRYRELTTTLPQAAYVKVRTPGGRYDITTSHNTPEADTQLTRGQRDDIVHCPGLHSTLIPATDHLTVSVPIACLANPAWVRVGVVSVVVGDVDSAIDEPYFTYFDDAHMTGGFEDHGTRLGPKVFAG
jgi:hypothetical protein